MKKILLAISLVIFISCTEDDDNYDILAENLVNQWTLDRRYISDDADYVLTDCMKLSSLDFYEDGTFKSVTYIEDENGVCTLTLEQTGNWWTNGYNGLYLEVNDKVDSMAATIGNLIDNPLSVETDPDGNHLYISNHTSTNQIVDIYIKNN